MFTYLGASVLSSNGNWTAILMGLAVLLVLPLIRAVMVYFLPLLFRLLDKPFIMNPKELQMCWYSGMVRGVIAFALCLQIYTKNRDTIVTTVLVVVLVTTILGSSFMQTFARWIKL